MLDLLRKIIHDCGTGKDNKTYTPDRVFGAFGFLVVMAVGVYHLRDVTFSNFWTGIGGYLTMWCVGIMAKTNAEPKESSNE